MFYQEETAFPERTSPTHDYLHPPAFCVATVTISPSFDMVFETIRICHRFSSSKLVYYEALKWWGPQQLSCGRRELGELGEGHGCAVLGWLGLSFSAEQCH